MKIFKKSYTVLLALLLLFVVGCLPNEVKAAEIDVVIPEGVASGSAIITVGDKTTTSPKT